MAKRSLTNTRTHAWRAIGLLWIAMIQPLAAARAEDPALARPALVDGARPERPHLWPWLSAAALTAFAASGAAWSLRVHDSVLLERPQTLRLDEAQRLRERAPWLTGTGIALGALGTASLAAAVIELLTVRTARDQTAWTFKVAGPQLTLRRRF